MKKFTKNCCSIICCAFLLLLIFYHMNDNQYGYIEPFTQPQQQINDLHHKNNNNTIQNTQMMDHQNNDVVKPFSCSMLKQKQFREIENMQDESIHFFKDVEFKPSCASIYSDSTGQACLNSEQSRLLSNRGNQYQSQI